jgi:hypothetical protein
MMATPTTWWQKLAGRLGGDPNPLRRRSDLLEAWLRPAAIILFLALCPVVAGVAGMWVRADNAATLRAERSWHPAQAILLRTAPEPEFHQSADAWPVWEPARWTMDGRQHTADIPVTAGSVAGSRQTVWLDSHGRVHAPAETPARLSEDIDAAMLISVVGLAILLGILVRVTRVILDRRRLARWETGWLAVGPIWSHQR